MILPTRHNSIDELLSLFEGIPVFFKHYIGLSQKKTRNVKDICKISGVEENLLELKRGTPKIEEKT